MGQPPLPGSKVTPFTWRTWYFNSVGDVPRTCSSLAHASLVNLSPRARSNRWTLSLQPHVEWLPRARFTQLHQYCIRLSLSHSRVWFSRTALGTFFAHPGHIVVGTVAVSDPWVRLELRLLCHAPRAVVSPALHTRLGCYKTAGARPVVVHASPMLVTWAWFASNCVTAAVSLSACLLLFAIQALAQRMGRRAVFGQLVRCILLLLGNLFRLGRPGLRRFALMALTAVRSESEAAIWLARGALSALVFTTLAVSCCWMVARCTVCAVATTHSQTEWTEPSRDRSQRSQLHASATSPRTSWLWQRICHWAWRVTPSQLATLYSRNPCHWSTRQ